MADNAMDAVAGILEDTTMEKVISEDYDITTCLEQLIWPEQMPLVVGYCRIDEADLAEIYFAEQREFVRRACNKRLRRGKYNIMWVIEVADGDLPTESDDPASGECRLGLTLAISILFNTSAAYFAAESMDVIATSSSLRQWFMEAVMPPSGAGLIIAEDVLPVSKTRVKTHAKARVHRKPKERLKAVERPITDEQIWEICNVLAWSDGQLDGNMCARLRIDSKRLSEIMEKHGYKWNGSAWASTRSVWDGTGKLKKTM